MKPGVKRIYDRFWARAVHPYARLEEWLLNNISPSDTVLDHGCGYTAPNLCNLKPTGAKLIGVDLVPFQIEDPQLTLISADIGQIPIDANSVDVVYSRSVMEHVEDPDAVFQETYRLLKPGGRWIFLTANRWDYVSVIARLVPNKFHSKLVSSVEGREEDNVFPTVYRCNSRPQVDRCARQAGFEVTRFDYFGQYPSYLAFSTPIFFVGSLYEKLIDATPMFKYVRGSLLVELTKPAQDSQGT